MSNEQTWKDRVKAVAEASASVEPSSPLAKTLEEFRATLDESPWIRAEWRKGPHPRLVSLIVHPKYRRDISATMLTFWLGPETITLTGTNGQEFNSEEKLTGYLADFVEKTAFPNTVAEFREIQGEDVHGTLRVKSLFEDDPADVPVLVDAANHNDLAKRALEKKLDAPIGIGVALEEHPRMGKFDASVPYGYLESGGFGLRIRGIEPSGKVLRIHGDVVALEDLPK